MGSDPSLQTKGARHRIVHPLHGGGRSIGRSNRDHVARSSGLRGFLALPQITVRCRLQSDVYDPDIDYSFEKQVGPSVSLVIFDTPGGDVYDRPRRSFYSFAYLFIIAFAVDSRESLEHVRSKYIPEIRRFLNGHEKEVPIILVGI